MRQNNTPVRRELSFTILKKATKFLTPQNSRAQKKTPEQSVNANPKNGRARTILRCYAHSFLRFSKKQEIFARRNWRAQESAAKKRADNRKPCRLLAGGQLSVVGKKDESFFKIQLPPIGRGLKKLFALIDRANRPDIRLNP
ncbi:MAG: hypothetical protein IJI37_04535 [Opitutales bacterium]|nr:hypothetical protein [Opitutales bacterium]